MKLRAKVVQVAGSCMTTDNDGLLIRLCAELVMQDPSISAVHLGVQHQNEDDRTDLLTDVVASFA